MKQISFIIISFLAYYLSGKVGLLLAIPPGFASAVWPASGVALACALLFGKLPASLGVAVASFVLNLALTSQGYNEISWETMTPAAIIASGAMIQCLVGAYLFQRLIGFPSLIDAPRDIAKFALIISPIGCLLGASVGVAALYFNGLISAPNYVFSWFTWWAGDTIGVLLFTPALLVAFSGQKHLVKARKLQVILPTLLIFSGVLLLFFASTSSHQTSITNEMNENANRFFMVIEERLNISSSKLRSYAAFYNTSQKVTREEFNQFSDVMLKNDSVFQAVGWTKIISADERATYEAELQASGYPDFTFTEIAADGSLKIAASREEYYPVLYIYPLKTNAKAFGLNLAANPQRLKALVLARKLDKPIATSPIRLAQETGSQYAYIIYLPVFHDGLQSREHFQGYISGVFRVGGLFADLLKEAKLQHYGMSIRDVSAPESPFPLTASAQEPLQQVKPTSRIFDFGGRLIEVEFYATKQYQMARKDWESWMILTGGLLLVALLQSFILMITGNTQNIQREVKRKTQALFEAKKVAEDANRSKSDFTANMSHEIRTPLHAIIGLVNLCLKTTLLDQQKDYLEKAKLASGTLLSLVNQILDYSKIEAGMLTLEQAKFELPELLSKMQAIFSTQASQQGIEFKLVLPPLLPDVLLGDALRLEQILLNLCSNAFKFTSQGTVQIIVKVTSSTETQVSLEFIVADSGIGISADQQKNLFQPYTQADTSTSRKFGGSGLGLTISKQLVELMGGSISLVSEENKGTRFVVHLVFPLLPETKFVNYDNSLIKTPAEEHQSIEVSPTSSTLSHDAINEDKHSKAEGKKQQLVDVSVLVVDDVRVNQIIAQAILQSHGATVTVAENGVEALATLAGEEKFDIILMDIQMPQMDGYEATRKIRENQKIKDIPIVAMTANAMTSDIEESKKAGMDGHIGKPFEEDVFIKEILAHLRT
ncbi:MAG: response regulator [Methylococcales bacterium]|nr:response regulator [Methylococcales bacterium]MBT7443809.1 response regulator [Methylococcales bacterium]